MANKQELFRAYLDESEDVAAGIYVVGGFVAKAEVWSDLEPKWLDRLPVGISFFHATDCFTGNNQFSDLDFPERTGILDKLTDLIIAHDVWLIGYGIDAATYRRFAPKAKQNEFLENKYAAPFGGAVGLACEAMGNTPGPQEISKILDNGECWERCAFFFEDNKYRASAIRVIESMRNSRELWYRDRIGPATYGSKIGPNGIALLQIADLGAFLVAKHISRASEGRISWKVYYDKLKNARRVYGPVLADKRSIKLLNQQHEELKTEAQDGRDF